MKTTICRMMLGTPALICGVIALASMSPTASGAAADATYFVLSHRTGTHGSCILPLTKPEDIAEARRQMALEVPTLIPTMYVARGADGINRDYLAPGKPAWRWHVTGFIGFAEGIAAENGTTPHGIERGGGYWQSATDGIASLPGYKPVAELMLEEIFFIAASLTPSGVQLRWLDLGTNYVYTVETSDAVEPPSWMAAAGGSWPIAATNWTDTTASALSPWFYRVKAERQVPPAGPSAPQQTRAPQILTSR